ncbi:MAG: ABC transporter substrate-binding protein [Halodesulfurarchaeum sp.]|nr:ABC transporter substrate-binding protein [Halodesulfurarchaeum sp.]
MHRRRFLQTGAATAITGVLAGCASPDEDSETGTTADENGTTTESDSTAYSVSMPPVGEVTFDAVPQRAAVYCSGYADMLVALGHGDAIASVGQVSRFHTTGYEELGVEVETDEIADLVQQGVSRETFLSIDADVHLMDPNWLINVFDGMDEDDVEQIEERVGPFFGNTIFRRTDEWHDYEYLTMYEAFEKVAFVFQETERYEAFEGFHDDVVDSVAEEIPAAGPQAALVWGGSDEPTAFSPYRLDGQGANKKAFHDLNVQDAFADSGVEGLSTGTRAEIDYETLLEVDPEVLFVRGHEAKTQSEFEESVLAFMQEHETASRITAVEEGAVYRGGPIYLGPIQHLYLLERFATQLYPERVDTPLFDRDELSGIITN